MALDLRTELPDGAMFMAIGLMARQHCSAESKTTAATTLRIFSLFVPPLSGSDCVPAVSGTSREVTGLALAIVAAWCLKGCCCRCFDEEHGC